MPKVVLGDSLEVLKGFEDNSVDAVVTDPPYGLSFMGKRWDYDVPSIALWTEVLRVLKPGGHLLSFGGTRTYHRMVVNIEDAGFEIRDQVMWIYGSGFPKSTDVSKRIDKEAGAEREVVGYGKLNPRDKKSYEPKATNDIFDRNKGMHKLALTAPSTSAAKQWQGFGSALKPANEPICLARKPLEKGLTLAENVLKWGCGGLNIDGSRIETTDNRDRIGGGTKGNGKCYGDSKTYDSLSNPQGRWPANILFDETAAEMLDEQSGACRSSGTKNKGSRSIGEKNGAASIKIDGLTSSEYSDSGGASRFFYVAKASKRERNAGLEGMPLKEIYPQNNSLERKDLNASAGQRVQNHHPTVKPIKLMEYLCKLITPPKGTILDPFMGSGSTGVAAKNLGFEFIGIEREAEYCEIANRRINATEAQMELA